MPTKTKTRRSVTKPARKTAKPLLKKVKGSRPLDRRRDLIRNASAYTGSRGAGRSATSAIP